MGSWYLLERLLRKKGLTTSGSSLVERSWMALTTIHMDDRRNITPKMTQALQRNKTLRHLTGELHPADLHSDNDTTRGVGTQPKFGTLSLWPPQSQNWYCIISRRIEFGILSQKSTPYVGKGLTILHNLTASHECWHGRVSEAMNSIPHAWQHNISLLLQLNGAGFNCKEWRL